MGLAGGCSEEGMKIQRKILSVSLAFFVVLFVLVSFSVEAKNTYLVSNPQTDIVKKI